MRRRALSSAIALTLAVLFGACKPAEKPASGPLLVFAASEPPPHDRWNGPAGGQIPNSHVASPPLVRGVGEHRQHGVARAPS